MTQTTRFSRLVGLAIVAGPMSFLALPVTAQDYVDVEAERAAAARAPGGAVVSYGASAAPVVVPAQPATTRMLPAPGPLGTAGGAPGVPGTPGADSTGVLFNQVQQLQQEVMRLNGVVEQLSYELGQLKEQSLERYMDIDRRLAGGSAAAPAAATPAAGAAATVAGARAGAEVAEQPGEGEAYRAAYALVRGQEFDAAVTAFRGFLERFPDGRYAPNAHYWLGELFLVIDPPDPEAARQSFMLLLNQYPDNAKVPDALYKLGRVQFIKGNSARAREYLNRVMREYPDSSAARLASDFIDENL
jgi:tol-pal system protein YbgF